MATNQETQTLEETLNKTDLGHIINENKKPIMIIGALVVAAIVGYSIMNQINTKSRFEKLDTIFKIEQTVFKTYMDDKSKAIEFKQALGAIDSELIAEPNLIPSLIAGINKLDQIGQADEAVLAIATNWLNKLNKTNHLHLFLAMRVAGLNEDANKTDEAIKILEGLVSSKSVLLKDKIHFDLGRLYLTKGDKKTAQERFEYIHENHKNSEFSKLAKLYMSGI